MEPQATTAPPIVTRRRIVETAAEYVGTRFEHQARVKGVAVDCIGLLVGVARELGLPHEDYTRYPRQGDGRALIEHLDRSCDRIEVDEALPGDILVFWFLSPDKPQHVGIRSFQGMIHTYASVGRVREHGFTKAWRDHIHSAYSFRGVVA